MSEEFIIKVPSEIKPAIESMDYFGEIHSIIRTSLHKKIVIDISDYQYIHPSFAVLIASTIYLGTLFKKNVVIRYNTQNKKSDLFLKQSGILDHYTTSSKAMVEIDSTNVENVGFKRFNELDEVFDTVDKILETAPVSIDEELKNLLSSKITEIFSNAFEHGKSEIGVFCCGYFNQSNDFTFSVYDAGNGICNNVNDYLKEDKICSESLKWALNPTHSTLNGIVDYPRGAGLHLLENFVKSNHGKIYLVSQGGYCVLDGEKREFHDMKNHLIGTIFSMSINADSTNIYSV